MISTEHTADWQETGRRVLRHRRRPVFAARMAGPRSDEVLLVDDRGAPLGIIVAPRPGAVAGVNRPTVYLQGPARLADGCPEHAA